MSAEASKASLKWQKAQHAKTRAEAAARVKKAERVAAEAVELENAALKACLKEWLEHQVGDCYTEEELATLAEEPEGYYVIWLKAWRLVNGGAR
jgi:hypothetical protein